MVQASAKKRVCVRMSCKQLICNSLFTPPTLTRLVHVGSVNTTTDKTRQFPISKFSVVLTYLRLNSYKLETWLRQDKTVLSCLQLCSHHRRRQDKTVLSCLCQRCEHTIRVLLRSCSLGDKCQTLTHPEISSKLL